VLQVPAWHTPEEMRQLSDLAHRIEGALLGTVAALALAQAGRRWSSMRARLLWPALLLTAGAVLLGYLLIPHHGLDRAGDQWRFVLGDAQQRQHVILALLVATGGGSELLYRTGRLRSRLWQLGIAHHRRWLSMAWPLTLLAASVLLSVYREPEGAYQAGRGTHTGH
jgi:hypothetical protein